MAKLITRLTKAALVKNMVILPNDLLFMSSAPLLPEETMGWIRKGAKQTYAMAAIEYFQLSYFPHCTYAVYKLKIGKNIAKILQMRFDTSLFK